MRLARFQLDVENFKKFSTLFLEDDDDGVSDQSKKFLKNLRCLLLNKTRMKIVKKLLS